MAGLLAAIGAGLALALLPYLLTPTFGGSSTLARVTGFLVIGSVTHIKSMRQVESERIDTRKAVFAFVALVALGGVLACSRAIGHATDAQPCNLRLAT